MAGPSPAMPGTQRPGAVQSERPIHMQCSDRPGRAWPANPRLSIQSRLVVALAAALVCAGPALAAPETKPLEQRTEKPEPKNPKLPLDLASVRAGAVEVDRGAAIAKANAWFNGAGTMIGDFVQIGPDGRR